MFTLHPTTSAGTIAPRRPSPGKLIVLLALALPACSAPRAAAAPEPAASPERGIAARVRADSLRRPYTEADIRFMSRMIHHHQQALVMAAWAPTHGASADIRRLAERIENGQRDEIATMRRWLEDRGQAPHTGHAMHMPGMLTEDQLRELDQARGAEFDRLFLTYMIRHHRGAVAMVDDLFATPGAAQDETVFKFARDASADQSTEIARMEAMLVTHIIETGTQ